MDTLTLLNRILNEEILEIGEFTLKSINILTYLELFLIAQETELMFYNVLILIGLGEEQLQEFHIW